MAETRASLEHLVSADGETASRARTVLEELNNPKSQRNTRSRREKGERRIVNGTATLRFEASGALLLGGDRKAAKAWCSGTLIGCDKFLTAAHCVSSNPEPSSYLVFFQNAGFFEVKDLRWPKEYEFPYADVALLTLARPVEGIAPIALNRAASPTEGSRGVIVGFGRTGGDNHDYGIKRQGSVSTSACKGIYAGKKLLCWDFHPEVKSGQQASNTCNADSGGGLFMWDNVGQRNIQKVVGVTSGGTKNDCLKGDYSYDTDLFQHQTWVDKESGARPAPVACGALPAWDVELHVRGATLRISANQPEIRLPLTAPAGLAVLRVAMNGEDDGSGRNDFNLYLFAPEESVENAKPTCAEEGTGQFGFCEIPWPKNGVWTIVVRRQIGEGLVQVSVTTVPSAN